MAQPAPAPPAGCHSSLAVGVALALPSPCLAVIRSSQLQEAHNHSRRDQASKQNLHAQVCRTICRPSL
jgi:hypothetical protein